MPGPGAGAGLPRAVPTHAAQGFRSRAPPPPRSERGLWLPKVGGAAEVSAAAEVEAALLLLILICNNNNDRYIKTTDDEATTGAQVLHAQGRRPQGATPPHTHPHTHTHKYTHTRPLSPSCNLACRLSGPVPGPVPGSGPVSTSPRRRAPVSRPGRESLLLGFTATEPRPWVSSLLLRRRTLVRRVGDERPREQSPARCLPDAAARGGAAHHAQGLGLGLRFRY